VQRSFKKTLTFFKSWQGIRISTITVSGASASKALELSMECICFSHRLDERTASRLFCVHLQPFLCVAVLKRASVTVLQLHTAKK
jgi:hypothetical protein